MSPMNCHHQVSVPPRKSWSSLLMSIHSKRWGSQYYSELLHHPMGGNQDWWPSDLHCGVRYRWKQSYIKSASNFEFIRGWRADVSSCVGRSGVRHDILCTSSIQFWYLYPKKWCDIFWSTRNRWVTIMYIIQVILQWLNSNSNWDCTIWLPSHCNRHLCQIHLEWSIRFPNSRSRKPTVLFRSRFNSKHWS